MTRRATWNITAACKGALYIQLLHAAAPLSAKFGLIVHVPIDRLREPANAVMSRLDPHLITVEHVTEWPGTKTFGGRTEKRFLYRITPDSLHVLATAARDLYAWVNPDLPEDLHLLRQDGSTVLGTIAQEDDGWLELEPEEYAALGETLIKSLRLIEQSDAE